ncbi:MAG: sialidase family protein [Anaerolineae bacterium]
MRIYFEQVLKYFPPRILYLTPIEVELLINSKLITRITISFFVLVTLCATFFSVAYSQTEDGWVQPTNLSQSGSSNSPILVKDASGDLYAFWKNAIDGYVLSTNRNGQWSDPQTVEPPFGTKAYESLVTENSPTPLYDPILIGDQDQGLHAFWVNGDDELSHSRIITGDLAALSNWKIPQQIDSGIVTVAAVSDESNGLHVAYLSLGNGGSILPGIYHRVSNDQGQTWSDSQAVYNSSFFRQATAVSSQLDFVLLENGALFLTWNDSFVEQVFTAEFSEGSWSAPQIIDSRMAGDTADSKGPGNIKGATSEDGFHLFWTAGHDGTNCSLYTRISTNSGSEWSFPQKLTEDTANCPDYFEVLRNDNLFLLFTKTFGKAELRVWRDNGWSAPFAQPELVEFTDPVNFRTTAATCPYQLEFQDSELVAIGCGTNIVEDIWVTSRPISSLNFPAEAQTAWSDAGAVVGEDHLIFSPQIITDQNGELHAIWVQNSQGYSKNSPIIQPGEAIFYSKGDGSQWPSANQILSSSGTVSNPTLGYSRQSGNLLVAWEDNVNQQIYFSRAAIDKAFNGSDWSEPIAIPAPFANPSSPVMSVSTEGIIYIAYIVPFNDDRGVYLISSRDNGSSWTEPVSVLEDKIGAFDILHDPNILVSFNGVIHLSFINRLSGEDSIRNELYHMRTEFAEEGEELKWLNPILIQNRFLQNNTIFSHDLAIDKIGTVHLIWQEWNETQKNLWSLTSTDNGRTWNEGTQISGFGSLIGNFDISSDNQNLLHLTQLFIEVEDGKDVLTLHHWQYIEDSWLLQPSNIFPDIQFNLANAVMAAGMTRENILSVMFSGYFLDQGRPTQGLFYTQRTTEVVEQTPVEDASNQAESPDPVSENSPEVVDAVVEESIESVEEPAVEVVVTLPVDLPNTTSGSLTPIQSFATNSPLVIGITLAGVIIGIMLLIVGGYFVIKFLANRQ